MRTRKIEENKINETDISNNDSSDLLNKINDNRLEIANIKGRLDTLEKFIMKGEIKNA